MYLADTGEIREADRCMIEDRGFPGVFLMETAGRKSAEFILNTFSDNAHFLILCGPGNNGGDGLVIARHLFYGARKVTVILSSSPDKYTGEAKLNYQACRALGIKEKSWNQDDWTGADLNNIVLIDALLGTGIDSKLRGSVLRIVDFWKNKGLDSIAVDLPSGLDSNTGNLINDVIPATHTLTFQLPKICHYVEPACYDCGEVHVIDIGILPDVIQKLKIKRKVIDRGLISLEFKGNQKQGHKGTFGHAALLGGSGDMPGAIALAALSSLKAGAGKSTAFIPGGAKVHLFDDSPEIMCYSRGDQSREFLNSGDVEECIEFIADKEAVAIGPGLGNTSESRDFLFGVLPKIDRPVILDADALNILADNPDMLKSVPEGSVLTPHPGEMTRLRNEPDPKQFRLESAEEFSRDTGLIILLKGYNSIIAFPDGRTFINSSGNASLATAGSGDVLTGLIAGFKARGFSMEQSLINAVFLHGKTAESGNNIGSAGDIIKNIPNVLNEYSS